MTAASVGRLFCYGQACRTSGPKEAVHTQLNFEAGLGAGEGEDSPKQKRFIKGAGRSKRTARGASVDGQPRSCPDSKGARHRSVALNKQLMKAGSVQVPMPQPAVCLYGRSASPSYISCIYF